MQVYGKCSYFVANAEYMYIVQRIIILTFKLELAIEERTQKRSSCYDCLLVR